jgi:acetylornithine deacetylase/succinyl-diaminopimelate desuccinylase-like protein
MPDKVRCDFVVNEGGGDSFELDGRRLYLVEIGEKGVFRFTLTTHGSAGHASIPRIGDNALIKLAPLIEALSGGRAELEDSAEAAALVAALGLGNGDLRGAIDRLEEMDPRLAVLVEPALGLTFTPTMASASEKINVIPARAKLKVDCRVPPGLGEDDVRRAVEQVLGPDGYTLEFDERVVGNRSAIETPLMDHIAKFVAREDDGAEVAPTVLPGFTDSRWFREAFPDCTAYGFFPQRTMGLFEAGPLIHGADERIPVADLGLAARFFAGLATEVLGA